MIIHVCYLGTIYSTRKDASCGQQGIGHVLRVCDAGQMTEAIPWASLSVVPLHVT
jgi:hypothetical protein